MNYLLTLLEGIASFISPCILPLLPIYISYFMGSSTKKNKALINSIFFVTGFSLVFILMAIITNKLGQNLLNTIKIIKIILGICTIFLGINYIGITKFNLFSGNKKLQMNLNSLSIPKSLTFGILFSVSMTPCVGTFLASALISIANEKEMLKGIIMMLLYCAGLGIPFIISSVLIEKMKTLIIFIKKNYNIIKIISGIILIIAGIKIIFF